MNIEEAKTLDSMLSILACGKGMNEFDMNLELKYCGIHITIPEQKKHMKKLIKDGMVSSIPRDI